MSLDGQNRLRWINKAKKIFKNQSSYLKLLDGIFSLCSPAINHGKNIMSGISMMPQVGSFCKSIKNTYTLLQDISLLCWLITSDEYFEKELWMLSHRVMPDMQID